MALMPINLDEIDENKDIDIEILEEGDEDSNEDGEEIETDDEEDSQENDVEDEDSEEDSSGDDDQDSDEDEDKPKSRRKRKSRSRERIQQLLEQNKRLKEEVTAKDEAIATASEKQRANSKAAAEQTKVALEAESEALKKSLAEAHKDGDYDKIAELNVQITENATKKLAVNWEIENSSSNEAPARNESSNVNQSASEEDALADELFQDWVSDNDWFLDPVTEDEEKLVRYVKRQNRALRKNNFDPADEDFWEELQERVEDFVSKKDLDIDGYDKPKSVKQKKAPSSSARTSTKPVAKGRKSVKLTASERDMAERLGVPLERYAAQVEKTRNAHKRGSRMTSVFGD